MTLAGYGLIGFIVFLLIGNKGIEKTGDVLDSWTSESKSELKDK